jgi:hypothetical protein
MSHLYLGVSLNSETSQFTPKDIKESLEQFLQSKCESNNPIIEIDIIEHSGPCVESCSSLNEHRNLDD